MGGGKVNMSSSITLYRTEALLYDKYSVYVTDGSMYRRLGIKPYSGGSRFKVFRLHGSQDFAEGYFRVPDLVAVLLGDTCEI